MDIIYIRDLQVETTIGIFDWEREVRQVVSLDLEMACDISDAAAADDIQHTLDYKAVAKRLVAFAKSSHFCLVETLAEQSAALVREEFGVAWLRLRVSKPGALRGAREVGVVIERGKMPS